MREIQEVRAYGQYKVGKEVEFHATNAQNYFGQKVILFIHLLKLILILIIAQKEKVMKGS